MFRSGGILLFCATAALAQSFNAGVKLGVPFTSFFETGMSGSLHGSAAYSSATRRYTVGLSGEWHWTRAVGFELDAMYHRLGYAGTVTVVNANSFTKSVFHVNGNAWDFPVLFKYRFGRGVQPYVAAGGTLRYMGPVHEQGEEASLVSNTTTAFTTMSPTDLNKRIYPGVTAVTGVDLVTGHFHVLPEIRYTHWTANISGSEGVLRLAPHQVEFLVGLSF